ncbi:MAG: hypothetical protein LBD75_01990 [Candidatus Peribacteria bacterium]|jgi:hypothetical protein|nr:hypothetical protein [Candidatus Peribacteria bacterium]
MAYSEYTPNPEAEIDASLDNEKILTSLTSLLTTPDQQVKAKPLLPLVLHIN